MSRIFTYNINKADLPISLGSFLRRCGWPEGLLAMLRVDGGVLVDGVFRRMIDPLQAGELISVELPPEKASLSPNYGLRLNVLYEDDDLAVLDKPDDMLVHPAGRAFDDAAGNFWATYHADETFRPIGRLDRHTTGALLLARNRLAAAKLTGTIEKTYYAIAEGIVAADCGVIDAPLLRVGGTQIRRVVDAAGQPSRTRYQVIQRLSSNHTLLEIHTETGRTHQIRVHLAYIGHPLAGDTLYGGQEYLIKRQALHCAELRLIQPRTNAPLIISSPLPPDMQSVAVTPPAARG